MKYSNALVLRSNCCGDRVNVNSQRFAQLNIFQRTKNLDGFCSIYFHLIKLQCKIMFNFKHVSAEKFLFQLKQTIMFSRLSNVFDIGLNRLITLITNKYVNF